MPRTATQRAIHRIRILKGLLGKLEASITEDAYCIDILKQSLAIQRGLKSLDALLLEKHIDSCVKGRMKGGKRSEELREELSKLYQLSRKGN